MPAFKQTQLDFAAHLRNPNKHKAPDGIEERRLEIYRNLFFNSISGLIAGTFPVLYTLLSEKEWHQLIREFYQEKYNKTPYFPEISREFVEFIKQKQTDCVRPFLYELAHYEWLELHLDKHLSETTFKPDLTTQNLLDNVPVINTVSSLNAYHYPVHQITKKKQPTKPLAQPVFLLLWRNSLEQVKFTELNTFSALLWESLQNNSSKTGTQLLTTLATQHQVQDKQQFIAFGSQTLNQWQKQDIISSTRTPQ